jgi:hypothetical protein
VVDVAALRQNGMVSEIARTHAWLVLFVVDADPAIASVFGLISADEYAASGFTHREMRSPISFQPQDVQPGQTVVASLRPQHKFRPDRLIIGGEHVADFLVNDVQVGNRSQFSQDGAIPADIFGATAIDSFVSFETALPQTDIKITVTNVCAEPRALAMVMIGTTFTPPRVEVMTRPTVEEALAAAPYTHRTELAAQVG